MQSSKVGMWKGSLALPTEGITKGYLFCQKWYIKEWGIGPRGWSSLYKPLLRTPGTSFFAEFLKTPCSYTEQGEIILERTKFRSLISVLEILPDIFKYCSWRSWRRRDKTEVLVRIFGGTSVSCKVKDKKNLRKLYFKHNVSRVVLMFFTKKYNLFVASPPTSCGNLIHCKKISFTS